MSSRFGGLFNPVHIYVIYIKKHKSSIEPQIQPSSSTSNVVLIFFTAKMTPLLVKTTFFLALWGLPEAFIYVNFMYYIHALSYNICKNRLEPQLQAPSSTSNVVLMVSTAKLVPYLV